MSALVSRKAALLVIDMAQEDRDKMGWRRDCAEEGIAVLSSVVASARRTGIPSIFVMYRSHPTLLPELAAAAGAEAPRFLKSLMSAFTLAEFERHLEDLRVDALIIGGWVSHLCVRDTVIDAIRNEYVVSTTEDILFHRAGLLRFPVMDRSELCLNAGRFTCYPDAASLVLAQMPGPQSV